MLRRLQTCSTPRIIPGPSPPISLVLGDVLREIEAAGDSSTITQDAFNTIVKKVGNAATAFAEITASTAELTTGGEEILKAMISLKEVSTKVNQNAGIIRNASNQTEGEMDSVSRISAEVTRAVEEINNGATEIQATMENLGGPAQKVSEVTEIISSE